MSYLQIIKEHRHVCRRITRVNIEISTGSDGQIHQCHGCQDAVGSDLLKSAAGCHIIELVIEEHPIEEGMGFGVDNIDSRISQELHDIGAQWRRIGLQGRANSTFAGSGGNPSDQRRYHIG